MTTLGTPLTPKATKVMMLGSGELGKEVVIELQRLGVEVIAVDRYENAPAQQVAHRAYTISMLDGAALRALVEKEKPDFIVLDPPRDGIHPKALPKIIEYQVDNLVYISCKPTSLARDLEIFLRRGYRVERCVCVDQFAQTVHTETICHLKHTIEKQ